MDFSDPLHPTVAREFNGAVSRDERRGWIFLANSDGLWVLYQNYAEDPKVLEDYARRALYDHSEKIPRRFGDPPKPAY